MIIIIMIVLMIMTIIHERGTRAPLDPDPGRLLALRRHVHLLHAQPAALLPDYVCIIYTCIYHAR